MGIESPVHLLFIAAVALIVLGPKRLPALAKALGQGIREFRESLTEGTAGEHPVERPPAALAPGQLLQASEVAPPSAVQAGEGAQASEASVAADPPATT